MISTIERDWICKNGVFHFPMKELPNWYGILNIGFVYHGEWSDSEVEYKGKRINSHDIEDVMWENYREDCLEGRVEDTFDGFDIYMKEHQNEVYEILEEIINREED